MQLVTWGRPGPNQSRIWQFPREDLEKGKWSAWEPELVQIPADFARDVGKPSLMFTRELRSGVIQGC